jgi:hypothetical protein
LTTKYLYNDRHYESPNLELLGKVLIFRHNKHLNFYRIVNIWRLILQKFLNYKSTELWQKPRTYRIRKLRHFLHWRKKSFPFITPQKWPKNVTSSLQVYFVILSPFAVADAVCGCLNQRGSS